MTKRQFHVVDVYHVHQIWNAWTCDLLENSCTGCLWCWNPGPCFLATDWGGGRRRQGRLQPFLLTAWFCLGRSRIPFFKVSLENATTRESLPRSGLRLRSFYSGGKGNEYTETYCSIFFCWYFSRATGVGVCSIYWGVWYTFGHFWSKKRFGHFQTSPRCFLRSKSMNNWNHTPGMSRLLHLYPVFWSV